MLSPRPRPRASPPWRKNATSDPIPAASSPRSAKSTSRSAPQPIKRNQSGRRIRRSTPEPGAHRNSLAETELRAPSTPARSRSADTALRTRLSAALRGRRPRARPPGQRRRPGASPNHDFDHARSIALEQRPQLVVAVPSRSQNLKVEVDLGRRGHRQPAHGRPSTTHHGISGRAGSSPPSCHSRRMSSSSAQRRLLVLTRTLPGTDPVWFPRTMLQPAASRPRAPSSPATVRLPA